jgi:putative oxygen-independent coproporphyrinogen III oxidase
MLTTPPLSVYIHLPWCLSKCPYCDFNSHAIEGNVPQDAYINALIADFQHDLIWIDQRIITSIFIGGGTPSLFSAQSLSRLLDVIFQHCPTDPSLEITLEANPGTVTAQTLKEYRGIGINRLSLGIQSFHDQHLKTLGRIHDGKQAQLAIEAAKQAGFNHLNLDLMHGLPNQTVEDGLNDLHQACYFEPTHLSWYQLTLEPNTWFARYPPKLPKLDHIWKLQDLGRQQLIQQGYHQYEISSFSKQGYQCQHNLNYWQFGDYLGIGAGAHSKITCVSKQNITRFSKVKHPKNYLNRKDNFYASTVILDQHVLPFEFMLNALRVYQTITFEQFRKRTGLSENVLLKSLEKAKMKELLTWDPHQIELTDLGRRFYNELLLIFME